jgi:hypothetical protein
MKGERVAPRKILSLDPAGKVRSRTAEALVNPASEPGDPS